MAGRLSTPRLSVVLGGGAARGLAHIGVLSVLERERITPSALVGCSMGALIAALRAIGLPAARIAQTAAGFRFPRWFVPGGLLEWEQMFAPACPLLAGVTFEQLSIPLAVVAVDLESGRKVILDRGLVLEAVRASCAVPGVMPPVELDGKLLVDGGVANVIPVDVAAMHHPDVVLAARVGSSCRTDLRAGANSFLARLARVVPNPLSARLAFDVLVRAAEIALEHQNRLSAAMSPADVLVDIDVGPAGLRDFEMIDSIVAAGARATEALVPALRQRLEQVRTDVVLPPSTIAIDPACEMVVSAARAKALLDRGGRTYLFCSAACRDAFASDPSRYLRAPDALTDWRVG